MTTVQQLREDGYTVKVRHNRNTQLGVVVDPKGGSTEVRIEKDGIGANGEAVCSTKDNYSRKIGRNIALGRALKELDGTLVSAAPPDSFGPED